MPDSNNSYSAVKSMTSNQETSKPIIQPSRYYTMTQPKTQNFPLAKPVASSEKKSKQQSSLPHYQVYGERQKTSSDRKRKVLMLKYPDGTAKIKARP